MSKIKFATLLFLLISVSFCSCQMGRKGKFQEYYEARTAVNLSDLIKIWRDYQRASETDFPINLDEAFGIRTFLADGNMLVGESNHFILKSTTFKGKEIFPTKEEIYLSQRSQT